MKVHAIEKVLTGETNKLEKLAGDIAPEFVAETIHKFRVVVKRLRAFLRLLAVQKEEPGIKLSKKFKQLYGLAGAIREAQLEISLFAKHKIVLPSYLTKLELDMSHNKQQWLVHYSKHLLNDLEHSLADNNFTELSTNTLRLFFEQQLTAIKTITRTAPTDDHIHSCRKHLKDMLYIARIIEKGWEEGYNELASFPLLQLEELAGKLGNYNDARIMLQQWMHFLPRMEQNNEAAAFQILCKEARLSQMASKKRVLVEIDGLLNKTAAWS